MISFSIPRTFTLRSILPTPVILREAEGEVAESTDMNELKPFRRWDRQLRQVMAGEEHFHRPLTCPARLLLPKGEDFPLLYEMWILQLRASPACRMTCEENEKSIKVSLVPL